MDRSFGIAPHKEAIELLKGKQPVVAKVFYGMLPELRGRAFTVAGIEGANVLQRVRDAIAALPQTGPESTWDKVRDQVAEELEGSHFSEEAAQRRAQLLLRVNAFQAYSASLWRVAQADDDTTHLQYIHGDAAKDPTPSHEALDMIVLPKDDPFWNTHTGPWGHLGCVCYVRPMNEDLVEEERQKDQEKIASGEPPENANVIEGKRLEGLRNGGFDRDGKHFDVSPPEQPGAFKFHPDDLRLPLGELKQRYDPEVWQAFELWARKNLAFEHTTVWNWLSSKPAFQKPDRGSTARNLEKTVSAIEQRRKIQEEGAQDLATLPGPRPPRQEPEVIGEDHQLEGMNKRERANVERMEAELLKLVHERGYVLDDNGNIAQTFNGDAVSVRVDPRDLRLLRGKVVTHNHPDGGTFSLKDVMTACTYQFTELRAVSRENTFSLRPGSNNLDLRALGNILKAVRRLAPGGLTMQNAHQVWKTIARENALNYVVS